MTVFGRDTLLTSYQTLLLGPSLAVGTLETLAALQAERARRRARQRARQDRARAAAGPGRGRGRRLPLLRQRRLDPAVPDPDVRAVPLDRRRRHDHGRCASRPCAALGWMHEDGDLDGRRLHRVPPPLAARPGVADLEGLVGLDALPRRHRRAHAGGRGRGAGLRLRRPPARGRAVPRTCGATRSWPSGSSARRRELKTRASTRPSSRSATATATSCWDSTSEKRQIDSLCSNIGHLLWSGIVDEPRAATGGRAADVGHAQLGLGRAHHVRPRPRLQPDRLPHRHRLAARQQPAHRRPGALRLPPVREPDRQRHARRPPATSTTGYPRCSPATAAA